MGAKKFSQEELNQQIQSLQVRYQKKMVAAGADTNALEALSKQMSQEMEAVVLKFQNQESRVEIDYLQQHLTDLNLEELVCESEKSQFSKMCSDPVIGNLINIYKDKFNSTSQHYNQSYVAKHSLKLNLDFAPDLKEALHRCEKVLKLKKTPNVYVSHGTAINACAFLTADGEINVEFTSKAIEDFSVEEFATVLGHEIGHLLFGHTNFPSHQILKNAPQDFTPLHAMRIFSWRRAAELSADRISLLCSSDFHQAAHTLFRVSYGFKVQDEKGLETYLTDLSSGLDNLKAHLSKEDFFASHPVPPVRLTALRYFADGEKFQKTRAEAADARWSDAQVEEKTTSLLEICDNSFLSNPENISEEVKNFFFVGGVIVGMSDGQLTQPECVMISKILQRPITEAEVVAMINEGPNKAWETLDKHALELENCLGTNERLMVLRDLCYIALADGFVCEHELKALYNIAGRLNVSGRFIDDVIRGQAEQAG